jgi:hypothetical protein
VPRSTSYLSRLVTADEPPGRARAPYRRGWGVRGVIADDGTPSTLAAPATPVGRNPSAPQPDTASTDRAGEKRDSTPRDTGDRDGHVRASSPRSAQLNPQPATPSTSPPSVQPPTATPPARRRTVERPAPSSAAERATSRAPVGPVSERAAPMQAAPAAPARPAEPTPADRDARAARRSPRESAVAVMPERARPARPTAQVAASLPRATADRRARAAAQPAAAPSIRIGTIDVHVTAPPTLAQSAHLLPPRVAPPSPAESERLSRPAAVFGLAQG